MKLVTFEIQGRLGQHRRLGALLEERIVDLTTAYATYLAERTDEPTPRELAPLPRPNSLCDFSIFEEHMTRREGGGIPKRPQWYRYPPYYKGNPDSIIGPEDAIPYPYYTDKLDLELEIGIIIGRGGRNLSPEAEFLGPCKRKDWATVLGPEP